MKAAAADPESDSPPPPPCVRARGRGVWQQKVHCLHREGGGSSTKSTAVGERETQRGGGRLSFFLGVGEERGRINRLICDTRFHTNTHTSPKDTSTRLQSTASSGSASAAAASASLAPGDKEADRQEGGGRGEDLDRGRRDRKRDKETDWTTSLGSEYGLQQPPSVMADHMFLPLCV